LTGIDLSKFALFASLDEPELQLVAFLLQPRELAPEQKLWREGDPSDGLWLLEQGVVRFETRSEGPLGQRAAPAWFGGASLVSEAPREASARAEGPARALLLSRTAFAQLLEAAPRTAARLLGAIGSELASLLHDGVTFMTERR
jgi:CRP-like cAMP-binding protein